jgi:DNA-binding transcriptional MerR regulator
VRKRWASQQREAGIIGYRDSAAPEASGEEDRVDWSIQDIARLAGTTSRTLRHYGDVGLLAPSRIGSNGYRYYDEAALARLQRILLLRELGLGIPAIAEVLEGQRDDAQALLSHLHWLEQEKERLDRQIVSVETTIRKMEGGEQLMAEEMLDGFDHTRYKEEVEERWGADAYARGNDWWTALAADDRREWQARQKRLADDWAGASARGITCETVTRRRHLRSDSSTGSPGFRARPVTARAARRRSTSWGSARCTWPTTASRRTTAVPLARPSCATRWSSTRSGSCSG